MAEEKIRKTTIVEQVMHRIKDLIASGKYKPGDRIPTEKELAESFGVGRSSIREAIKIFNYMGVLKSQAAKGTYLEERSNISSESLTWSLLLGEDELHEMIDLRGSIETWALFSLIDKLISKKPEGIIIIGKLTEIVEGMKISADLNDRNSLVDADFLFHKTIINSCDNALFTSLFETLRSFLYDEIEKSQLDYQDLKQIPLEHGELLEAIMSEDKSVVYTAHNRHILNIKDRLKNHTERSRAH